MSKYPHWNCRCRSGNPAVERGRGQGAYRYRSRWGREDSRLARVLSLGRLRHARAFARHGQHPNGLPQIARRPQRDGFGPGNPAVRRQTVAAAALAGWRGGRIANGWWRHGDGGYGWVGPLFWPFAIYDIYDYAIWGDGIGFWDYGYPDIYAAIFAPYGRDDLAAYTGPSPYGRRHRRVPPLQQLCGDDSREIAGLLIDQIQQAIQPNEAQRAALDELADALISAAQMIRASCPTQAAFTAPEPIGRHAAAHRGDDAGRVSRAAAAGEFL